MKHRNWIHHNSHEPFYREPFGALPCKEEVTLRLSINSSGHPEDAVLCLSREDQTWELKMKPSAHSPEKKHGLRELAYETTFNTPESSGLLWYYFKIEDRGRLYYYGNNQEGWGGVGEIRTTVPPSYQITVYEPDRDPPEWFREGIVYQIFVDRFFNGHPQNQIPVKKKNSFIHSHWSNTPFYIRDPDTEEVVRWDFFGGNLLGVKKKLSYLKKLGITTIYLNPIFEAPSNHKYDTGDYHRIDPMFGDEQLFQSLCQEAEKMGIRIILDGVFSHTGSDSVYFNKEGNYDQTGAYQSPDSPYYSWYNFTDYPDDYDCWWGVKSLPNVNELDPSYQKFIATGENSVIRHWMSRGAYGWRLDVADELPGKFIKILSQTVKEEKSDAVLIGEVWEDASNKISYGERREYLLGRELDSVTNYPFRDILLEFFLGRRDARTIHRFLMSLYENYPLSHFYSTLNLIGSHDVPRILTLLSEAEPEENLETEIERSSPAVSPQMEELGKRRLRLLALLQMTFPGVPCIYYGDEAGMHGYDDPYCRGTYPWGEEDQELLSWYHRVIRLRNERAVLRSGDWTSFYSGEDVYGYVRSITGGKDIFGRRKENDLMVIVFHRGSEHSTTAHVDLRPWSGEFDKLVPVFETGEDRSFNRHFELELDPLAARVFEGIPKKQTRQG